MNEKTSDPTSERVTAAFRSHDQRQYGIKCLELECNAQFKVSFPVWEGCLSHAQGKEVATMRSDRLATASEIDSSEALKKGVATMRSEQASSNNDQDR